MSHFFGTHQNRLDAKGRVSIPAPYRTHLRNGSESGPVWVYLRLSHKYACIDAWPEEVFQKFLAKVDRLDSFSDDQDDFNTSLFADAERMEADKEGRIVLPDYLVQHAGLTDNVTFMGQGRTFQIWEPAAGAQRRIEARASTRLRESTLSGGQA